MEDKYRWKKTIKETFNYIRTSSIKIFGQNYACSIFGPGAANDAFWCRWKPLSSGCILPNNEFYYYFLCSRSSVCACVCACVLPSRHRSPIRRTRCECSKTWLSVTVCDMRFNWIFPSTLTQYEHWTAHHMQRKSSRLATFIVYRLILFLSHVFVFTMETFSIA